VRPGIVSRDAQGRFDCRCVAQRTLRGVHAMPKHYACKC
jgi:hypothetical protein